MHVAGLMACMEVILCRYMLLEIVVLLEFWFTILVCWGCLSLVRRYAGYFGCLIGRVWLSCLLCVDFLHSFRFLEVWRYGVRVFGRIWDSDFLLECYMRMENITMEDEGGLRIHSEESKMQ